MGWLWTEKPSWMTALEYLKSRIEAPVAGVQNYEVIESGVRGRVAFFAVKRLLPTPEAKAELDKAVESYPKGYPYVRNPDGTYVFCCVFLFSTKRDGYLNFGYKDMDEGMHPYYYDCPAKVFKALSPFRPDADPESGAVKWRENVESIRAGKKKAEASLNPGDVIVFDPPLEFTGDVKGTEFKVERWGVRKLRFREKAGWVARIPKWRAYPHKIMRAA